MRYNSNGTVDTGFGNAGKVTTDFSCGNPAAYQEVNAVALQPDGKIVVAGFLDIGCQQQGAWWLSRYNANGTLDTTFGNGGIVRTAFVNTWDEHATAIVIQPDGKIVAAGFTVNPSAEVYQTLILARYNTDGTLDSSFGESGRVLGDKSHGGAYALARQSDGKLVIATNQNQPGSLVGRYNSSGIVDTTFGNNGWAAPGLAFAQGVAIQSQGKIVVVGNVDDPLAADLPYRVGLSSLNSNGTLDRTFGINGKATGDYADTAKGVAIQSDDKIVLIAGEDCCGLMLARYLSSWLLGPVSSINSASGTNPSVTNSTANLSATTTGSGTVSVAQYASNPGGATSFSASGLYYDIHISGTFTSVVVSFCGVNLSATMYFWDGTAWRAVSNQTVVGGCVQVTVNASTVPNLTQLTGTLFGSSSGQQQPPAPIATPTPKSQRQEDSYEPDNSMALAHTITGAELHNFCGANDEDWVKFTAAAGQTYHIKADAPTNFPTEPHLELYVNGNLVAQNDHYFGNIAEIWWWSNGSDATAYVRATEVKGRGDCGSSSYTLSVQVGKP